MNPICKVDINRPDCQKWMVEAYAKCRDLFSTQSFPSWWLNDTPAVYKDVRAMTAEDCHRLKRELAREVAEEDGEVNNIGLGRMVGLFMAIGAIFILFILLCGMKRQSTRPTEVETAKVEPQEDPPTLRPMKNRNKTPNCKSWMRRSCRRFFLHNESQIRESKSKAEREVAIHNERTQRKIVVWTKAGERDAQKKREKLQRRLEKASRK
ncbi:uncharacterized protein [Drosophila takahashii]|uniref:uncharacterized protein n=1 Tax=Drosophila takahashii TaxID=29030 RepID=UPI001CF80F46|nr:uncharacterized protein LOC108060714 [Drosophila takahashii]